MCLPRGTGGGLSGGDSARMRRCGYFPMGKKGAGGPPCILCLAGRPGSLHERRTHCCVVRRCLEMMISICPFTYLKYR